jgi:hypothetical protein
MGDGVWLMPNAIQVARAPYRPGSIICRSASDPPTFLGEPVVREEKP